VTRAIDFFIVLLPGSVQEVANGHRDLGGMRLKREFAVSKKRMTASGTSRLSRGLCVRK